MSAHEHHTHWTDTSEHHGFHPHVLPLKVYLGVFGALMVLTAATVGLYYLDPGHLLVLLGASESLHHPVNMILSMIIATTKAALVAMIFMHLFFDNKFYLLLFLSSLLFLGVFIIVTLFDTERRGDIDTYREQVFRQGQVNDVADFYYDKNLPLPGEHRNPTGGHGDAAHGTDAGHGDAAGEAPDATHDSAATGHEAEAAPAAPAAPAEPAAADGHDGHDH